MDEVPETGREPVSAGLWSGNNDIGNQRLVRLVPVFHKGWEFQLTFKHHDAYVFRIYGAEN